MTYTTTYEFTAFSEADLLAAGAEGSSVSCGDTFTMPGSATTCFEVTDDDRYLSGDSYCNENSNDHYYQTASITDADTGAELGNGGQIYAECYYVLHGSDGRTYYLIEIEQEGGSGDYFTFYGAVPPEGVELTVSSQCNVTSNWVDFTCLDAGEKIATGTISGTVWCDLDCDGVQDFEVTYTKGENIFTDSVTFESVSCTTYNVDCYGSWSSVGYDVIDLVVGGAQGHYGNAYDNTIVELDKGGVWRREVDLDDGGKFCLSFDVYKNSCVGAQGNTFKVKINGVVVEEVVVREDGTVEVEVDLQAGMNTIEFVSRSDVSGYGAGIDDIELLPLVPDQTEVEPTKAGVTIKLLDADGNLVDTTVTDADGNYTFDNIPVGDYRIMGVAPDGTEFTIQDAGSDDSVDSDVDGTGTSGLISVTADSVTDVDLGVCEVKVGSLSGRYFCDDDRDGLDNDGPNGGPSLGIGGVRVDLLDAAGNLTGVFTITDSNGGYSFNDLAAGVYGVRFASTPVGKELTATNVDGDASDDIDSDAVDIGGGASVIREIIVVAGADTPDNDVGVTFSNEDPEAAPVAAAVCADEDVVIDLLAAVTDPDGDTIQITSISDEDETVGVGGSITLAGGGTATLNMDGTVTFSTNGAYDDVLIRASEMEQFQFTAEDGQGGSATADASVKVCGALNTIETIAEGFTDDAGGTLQAIYRADPFVDADFSTNPPTIELRSPVTVTDPAPLDERLQPLVGDTGQMVYDDDMAYCVDKNGLLENGFDTLSNLYIVGSDAMNTANAAIAGAVVNEENLDIVTWIINQGFQSIDAGALDDGDLGTAGTLGRTYSFSEVQDAIWWFTDGAAVDPTTEFGANSQEIIDFATIAGEGFVAGEGDKVAVLFDPVDEDRQTYVVAVEFDALKEDCFCFI